jgi:hypothetical protein
MYVAMRRAALVTALVALVLADVCFAMGAGVLAALAIFLRNVDGAPADLWFWAPVGIDIVALVGLRWLTTLVWRIVRAEKQAREQSTPPSVVSDGV